jgi:hypothetical protein
MITKDKLIKSITITIMDVLKEGKHNMIPAYAVADCLIDIRNQIEQLSLGTVVHPKGELCCNNFISEEEAENWRAMFNDYLKNSKASSFKPIDKDASA